MSKKTVVLLISILLIAALIVFFKFNEPNRKLVPAFDLDSLSVNKISIKTDSDTLILVKKEGNWFIQNLDYYPANKEKVADLFNHVFKAKRSKRILTRQSSKSEYYRVTDKTGTNLILFDQNNAPLLNVFFGTSDLYTFSCMRFADNSTVYEMEDSYSEFIFPRPETWRDPYIFRFEEPDLQKIIVSYSRNNYSILRDKEAWLYKDAAREFPVTMSNRSLFKIVNILKNLQTLKLEKKTDAIKSQYLHNEILRVKLNFTKQKSVELVCYQYDKDNAILEYYGNLHYVFFVPYDFVNRFTKSPENFEHYENTY